MMLPYSMKRGAPFDVLVVGAGLSGLHAAAGAAERGAQVLLVDDRENMGGWLAVQTQALPVGEVPEPLMPACYLARSLAHRAMEAGVQLALNTTVWHLEAGMRAVLATGRTSQSLVTPQVILATGALEQPMPFPGWTLPGVMLASAAQTLIVRDRIRPGNRALIVGASDQGLLAALDLKMAGVDVVAVVDAAGDSVASKEILSTAQEARIDVRNGWTIRNATGHRRIESVEISLGAEGSPLPLEVDLVCLADGLAPATELAQIAGVKMRWDVERNTWFPEVTRSFETSVPALYCVGAARGTLNFAEAITEGLTAGHEAASRKR